MGHRHSEGQWGRSLSPLQGGCWCGPELWRRPWFSRATVWSSSTAHPVFASSVSSVTRWATAWGCRIVGQRIPIRSTATDGDVMSFATTDLPVPPSPSQNTSGAATVGLNGPQSAGTFQALPQGVATGSLPLPGTSARPSRLIRSTSHRWGTTGPLVVTVPPGRDPAPARPLARAAIPPNSRHKGRLGSGRSRKTRYPYGRSGRTACPTFSPQCGAASKSGGSVHHTPTRRLCLSA